MAYDAQAPAEVTARDRVIMLRDFLAQLNPGRFDMCHPGDEEDSAHGDCKMPACMGGWARAIFRYDGDLVGVGVHLGLSPEETSELFFWMNSAPTLTYKDVTLPMAVGVLDHYLATGAVDWSAVWPE